MNRRRMVVVAAAAALLVGLTVLSFVRPWEASPQDRKILDEKKALAAEYISVLQGANPDAYMEHYSRFLKEIGQDPTKRLPTLVPAMGIAVPYVPSPLPTGAPPIPTPLTSTPTVVSVPMTVAWGSQINVDKVPVAVDAGHVFVLDTITPDAMFLVGAIYPLKFGTEAGKEVMIDLRTRQVTVLHTFPSRSIKSRAADAEGDWVAWLEVDEYEDISGWALYGYNRKTTATKKIDGEEGLTPCSGCGRFIELAMVSGDRLIWQLGNYSSRPPSVSAETKSTDLTTGETQTVSSFRQAVNMAPPTRNTRLSVRQDGPNKILVWDATQQQLVRLSNPGVPSGVVIINGNGLAWTGGGSLKDYLYPDRDEAMPNDQVISVMDVSH